MKGKQKGRPLKWVRASVKEYVSIGRPGVEFEVWHRWRQKDRKLGTLIVSVGGLRWWPRDGKLSKKMSWDALAQWFTPPSHF
jgi:hypothetical protein